MTAFLIVIAFGRILERPMPNLEYCQRPASQTNRMTHYIAYCIEADPKCADSLFAELAEVGKQFKVVPTRDPL
jgi:hypothetical protein